MAKEITKKIKKIKKNNEKNMKNLSFYIYLYLIIFTIYLFNNKKIYTTNLIEPKKAVIIVPVADLLSRPILAEDQKTDSLIFNSNYFPNSYDNIPFASADKSSIAICPRIYQLLFNEIVKIVKIEDQNSLISIENVFCIQDGQKSCQRYYISNKSILIISDTIPDNAFPSPRNSKNRSSDNTVTLKLPFYDSYTDLTFSAGTRFVSKKTSSNKIIISIFNPKDHTINLSSIDKRFICYPSKSIKKKQAQFVEILKEWANNTKGFIPYVWGGASFTNYYNYDDITINNFISAENLSAQFYDRPNYKYNIKTGFDCSGLILSAAQICEIPYFYKNTTTLGHYLKPLTANQKVEAGDLILFKGHVQIISDLKKNYIIEAVGYMQGYGKVHEKHISSIYKNIDNINQLAKAYFADSSLERIAENGNSEIIKNFKILKFSSIWDI